MRDIFNFEVGTWVTLPKEIIKTRFKTLDFVLFEVLVAREVGTVDDFLIVQPVNRSTLAELGYPMTAFNVKIADLKPYCIQAEDKFISLQNSEMVEVYLCEIQGIRSMFVEYYFWHKNITDPKVEDMRSRDVDLLSAYRPVELIWK